MKIDSYAVSSTAISEYYSFSSKVAIVQNDSAGRSSLSLAYSDSQTSIKSISGSYETYGQINGVKLPEWASGLLVDGDKAKQPDAGLVEISDEAKRRSDEAKEKSEQMRSGNKDKRAESAGYSGKSQSIPSTKEELKMMILERLLEYLGKQDYGSSWQRIRERLDSIRQESERLGAGGAPSGGRGAERTGASEEGSAAKHGGQGNITVQIKFYEAESTYEKQSMSFSSQGVVKTADGKEIAFDVSLNMSSEHYSFKEKGGEVSIAFPVCDPLVINYAGTAASLTDEKFEFDLDFDGNMDNISFVGQGSGFLALDKNDDGVINDGSELFGPKSGAGFEELREYDEDRNGWIDENDEVYSRLKVWSKDAEGNDVLMALKELDIGAIYLGDTKTDYTMTDSTYNAAGIVRSTSVFLHEDGRAGTIQHIDLAV